MSVLQVVSSSRIGNAIYFTAGSIIAALVLPLFGFPLDLTVDTVLVVIPVSALFGSILWASQPDRKSIELFIILYLKLIPVVFRKLMADLVLFLRPWEMQVFEARRISVTIREESLRISRSAQLRSDIDEVTHVIWVVVLSFLTLILLEPFLEMWLQILPVLWIMFVLTVTIPAYLRKRSRPRAILLLAMCTWLDELLKNEEHLRSSEGWAIQEFQPDSELSERRNSLGHWARSLIEVASREDWDGFGRNAENFIEYLNATFQDMEPICKEVTFNYLGGWAHYLGDQGNFFFRTIIINATLQIRDAILEITESKDLPEDFSVLSSYSISNLIDIVPILRRSTKITKDAGWIASPIHFAEFIGLLQPSLVSEMPTQILKALYDLPNIVYSTSERKFVTSPSNSPEALAIHLLTFIDYPPGHIGAVELVKSAANLCPCFPVYVDYSRWMLQIILEEGIGLCESNVQNLVDRWLDKGYSLDYEKLAKAFRAQKRDRLCRRLSEHFIEDLLNDRDSARSEKLLRAICGDVGLERARRDAMKMRECETARV